MSSNSISYRRTLLRRPIVCHPPPPPPPAASVELFFIPSSETVDTDDQFSFELKLCHSGLPQGENVSAVWTIPEGDVDNIDDLLNCETISGEYNAPSEPWVGQIKLVVQWSDSTIAITFLDITVEGEEPD